MKKQYVKIDLEILLNWISTIHGYGIDDAYKSLDIARSAIPSDKFYILFEKAKMCKDELKFNTEEIKEIFVEQFKSFIFEVEK